MQALAPQRLACYDEFMTAMTCLYHGKKFLEFKILYVILPVPHPSPRHCDGSRSPLHNEHSDLYSLSSGITLRIGPFLHSVTHFAN